MIPDDRLYRRVGTIAICSLVIGLIGMIASMALLRVIPRVWANSIWNVGALFMLPSLIGGVVALTGARKVGSGVFLWKGIVSVVIPIALYIATIVITARAR